MSDRVEDGTLADAIRLLHEHGITDSALIARTVGATRAQVLDVIAPGRTRAGRPRRPLTHQQAAQAAAMRSAGVSVPRIAAALAVPSKRVLQALRDAHIEAAAEPAAACSEIEAPAAVPAAPEPEPPDAWRAMPRPWRLVGNVRTEGRDAVESVRLRDVPLWGRLVLIDARYRVLCDGCRALIPFAEIGRRHSRHVVALPPGAVRVLAMNDELCDEHRQRGQVPALRSFYGMW